MTVHNHDGPKGASPETVHGLKGDFLVWSGLPALMPKLSFELLSNA